MISFTQSRADVAETPVEDQGGIFAKGGQMSAAAKVRPGRPDASTAAGRGMKEAAKDAAAVREPFCLQNGEAAKQKALTIFIVRA